MAAQGQARSETPNGFKTKLLLSVSGSGRCRKRSAPLRGQCRTALPVAGFNNGTGRRATNRKPKVMVVVMTNPAQGRQCSVAAAPLQRATAVCFHSAGTATKVLLRCGQRPFPHQQTPEECMKTLIGRGSGRMRIRDSRKEPGRLFRYYWEH